MAKLLVLVLRDALDEDIDFALVASFQFVFILIDVLLQF